MRRDEAEGPVVVQASAYVGGQCDGLLRTLAIMSNPTGNALSVLARASSARNHCDAKADVDAALAIEAVKELVRAHLKSISPESQRSR